MDDDFVALNVMGLNLRSIGKDKKPRSGLYSYFDRQLAKFKRGVCTRSDASRLANGFVKQEALGSREQISRGPITPTRWALARP